MLKKPDIDLRVARALGMTRKEVAAITSCFLRVVLHAIVEEEEVHLSGFGKFLLRMQKNDTVAQLRKGAPGPAGFKKGVNRGAMHVLPPHKFRVWFKKADAFREIIWDRFGKPSEGEQLMSNEDMEKYGVDENVGDQEALEKRAKQGCPVDGCDKKPERHGTVLVCPVHGSEPFEGGT